MWLTIRRRSPWPAAEGPGPRAPTTEATSAQRQKTLRSANAYIYSTHADTHDQTSRNGTSSVGGTYCSRTATKKTCLPLGLRRDGRCSCEAYRQTETVSEATTRILYAERQRERSLYLFDATTQKRANVISVTFQQSVLRFFLNRLLAVLAA